MVYKYSNFQNFEDCLTPEEMNFYWHGTETVCFDLLFDFTEETIGERDFTSNSLIGENDTGCPYYHYLHRMINTYGIWILNTNEPNTFD
jgi:hypothetical protein